MFYNPNLHHRRSIRLKGYDYSQAGLYFITICVQNHVCLFGKIENGEPILNELGQIAFNEWMRTPEIRSEINLGAFIVMPNHVHGIIEIANCNHDDADGRGELHSLPLQNTNRNGCNIDKGECNSPLRGTSNTIGAIVRGYKSAVTKQIHEWGFTDNIWQRNYYEHIIRNEQSYQNISGYIINNPVNWKADKFYVG
jgi:REP element-mobilizing transposase RayT